MVLLNTIIVDLVVQRDSYFRSEPKEGCARPCHLNLILPREGTVSISTMIISAQLKGGKSKKHERKLSQTDIQKKIQSRHLP
jgi:hypothetical protein